MSPGLERVGLCSGTTHTGHQNQVLWECPLCGLPAPFCGSWATIAVSIPVNWNDTKADSCKNWKTAAYDLICRAGPTECELL